LHLRYTRTGRILNGLIAAIGVAFLVASLPRLAAGKELPLLMFAVLFAVMIPVCAGIAKWGVVYSIAPTNSERGRVAR
jgi:hypothetical protein